MDNSQRGPGASAVSAPAGVLLPEGLLEIGCEARRTAHLSGPTGRWILTGKKLTIILKGRTGVYQNKPSSLAQ